MTASGLNLLMIFPDWTEDTTRFFAVMRFAFICFGLKPLAKPVMVTYFRS